VSERDKGGSQGVDSPTRGVDKKSTGGVDKKSTGGVDKKSAGKASIRGNRKPKELKVRGQG